MLAVKVPRRETPPVRLRRDTYAVKQADRVIRRNIPTFLHVAARGLGPPCGPYMPRGLRAGFRLDAMIRRASRRWLSSASSAI